MSRPKNSKEFRESLALQFIRLLSEKELLPLTPLLKKTTEESMSCAWD